MSAFSAIDIGRTGAGFAHYWLDVVGHNIANVNTVRAAGEEPFRARLVVAQANGDQIAASGSGVHVRQLVEDGSEPPRIYDPGNPLADADGYVTMPVVDLARELTDMIIANRSYQASMRSIDSAREAYASALRIGQR